MKNSGFDLVYMLTQNDIATTIAQYPNGVYFLNNITDNINLGNNTVVQDDYGNLNIAANGMDGIKLNFVNRFIPSLGTKQLQIKFYVGYFDGNFSFPVSDIFTYQSTVITAPYQKQNVQWNITEKTNCFDYAYTLSDEQWAETKIAFPTGVFYLYDNTDEKSLGNNTLVQNDFAKINLDPANKELIFQNRVLASYGAKNVHLRFWTGSDSVFIYNIVVNVIGLPFESTYTFTTRPPTFDLTYTLTPYQLADTITRFPNGIFYLNDSTDNLNLGNNTNVQNDYANINVSVTNQNKLVFLNRTPPTLGLKSLNVQFYVGYNDGNIGYAITENIPYEALAASNVCFAGDTPILTDQGELSISLIDPKIHTIHKKKIVAITKTIHEHSMVCFEKDSLYPNVPSRRTVMTSGHRLFYKGQFIHAKEFLWMKELKGPIYRVENCEPVYNVLMEEPDAILVNNLVCETLHPQNKIAKLYTEGSSLEEYAAYYENIKKEVKIFCEEHNLCVV